MAKHLCFQVATATLLSGCRIYLFEFYNNYQKSDNKLEVSPLLKQHVIYRLVPRLIGVSMKLFVALRTKLQRPCLFHKRNQANAMYRRPKQIEAKLIGSETKLVTKILSDVKHNFWLVGFVSLKGAIS